MSRSGEMRVDLRWAIGLLFLIDGFILVYQGIASGSLVLGINVNLWWGLVMLIFGAVMAAMGRTRDDRGR
jgi:hypothetical protein